MLARVIDVTDHEIYLEIEKQLRFKSHYVVKCQTSDITRDDRVNFFFTDAPTGRFSEIIISDIIANLKKRKRNC